MTQVVASQEPHRARIWLVRHGQTDWNVQGRIQGHQPIPLNDTGRKQAADLARYFLNKPFSAIYTSDLPRAVETGTIMAQALNLNVEQIPDLRERALGKFEGMHIKEFRALRAARKSQAGTGDLADWSGIEGIESDSALWDRAQHALRQIATRHTGPGKNNQGEDLLVVSHGGLLSQVIWNTLGIAPGQPRRFPLSNGIVVVLTCDPTGFFLHSLVDLPLLIDHAVLPDTSMISAAK